MANASYEVLEFRAVIKPEWTELYVRCGPDSDGGMLVGGWYKATIGPTAPAIPALEEALRTSAFLTASEWSRGAPP